MPVDLPAWATNEVGPLPVWAWGVAGVAGVGLGIYLRNRISGSQGAAKTVPAEIIYTPAGAGGITGSGAGAASTVTPSTSGGITSNTEWRRRALKILTDQGYNPTTADIALSKYLAGNEVTEDQQAALDIVLGSTLGLPPQPGTIKPAASPPPPEGPPTNDPLQDAPRTYTVVRGDTLSAIAQRYYGRGSQWRRIYDANRDKISNPDLIYPGQVLVIP